MEKGRLVELSFHKRKSQKPIQRLATKIDLNFE